MQERRALKAAMADGPENCGAQKGTVFGEAWLPIISLFFLQTRVPLQVFQIQAHDAVSTLERWLGTGLGANMSGLGTGLGANMFGTKSRHPREETG